MRRSRRILLIAAAVVLLLAGAAVAAKIVIDLGAVVVKVGPRPSVVPSAAPSPPLGERITLREARILLDDDVPLPRKLGSPDGIWGDRVLTDAGEIVRISAAWRPRPGLPRIPGTRYGAVLMRFQGEVNTAFKTVYEDTGVFEPVTIDGAEGYWTTGRHLLQVLTREGVVHVRVEGNVLLWRDGIYTMRLETSLPKAEAVRIAASIPRAT
jgi:hypothetical protein